MSPVVAAVLVAYLAGAAPMTVQGVRVFADAATTLRYLNVNGDTYRRDRAYRKARWGLRTAATGAVWPAHLALSALSEVVYLTSDVAETVSAFIRTHRSIAQAGEHRA